MSKRARIDESNALDGHGGGPAGLASDGHGAASSDDQRVVDEAEPMAVIFSVALPEHIRRGLVDGTENVYVIATLTRVDALVPKKDLTLTVVIPATFPDGEAALAAVAAPFSLDERVATEGEQSGIAAIASVVRQMAEAPRKLEKGVRKSVGRLVSIDVSIPQGGAPHLQWLGNGVFQTGSEATNKAIDNYKEGLRNVHGGPIHAMGRVALFHWVLMTMAGIGTDDQHYLRLIDGWKGRLYLIPKVKEALQGQLALYYDCHPSEKRVPLDVVFHKYGGVRSDHRNSKYYRLNSEDLVNVAWNPDLGPNTFTTAAKWLRYSAARIYTDTKLKPRLEAADTANQKFKPGEELDMASKGRSGIYSWYHRQADSPSEEFEFDSADLALLLPTHFAAPFVHVVL